MAKPSILIVPGAMGYPELYAQTVAAVAAKGYEIKAIHNPSAGIGPGKGREGVYPTMYDDAANLASEVEKLADEGKDVLVVAHSYGGIVASEGSKGLGKAERQKQGKKGGIVRLAYMNAIVPQIGGSAAKTLAGVSDESKLDMKIDENGWLYHEDFASAARICCGDIPEEDGVALIKSFTLQTAISMGNELTHAGYKDIPVSFLVGEDDLCVPTNIQKDEIEMIEKEGGKKVDVTIIKAAHIPNHELSVPQKVTDWIIAAAEKA